MNNYHNISQILLYLSNYAISILSMFLSINVINLDQAILTEIS